ncbi:hypothetical protein ACJX0J_007179, partial [Zea mays]
SQPPPRLSPLGAKAVCPLLLVIPEPVLAAPRCVRSSWCSSPPGDPAPCCVRSIFLRRHAHHRCEGMSTYPRTYDLIHADSMFTLYKNRCEMDRILLEMDRILRPRGTVIIREDVDLLVKVKSLANGISRRTV